MAKKNSAPSFKAAVIGLAAQHLTKEQEIGQVWEKVHASVKSLHATRCTWTSLVASIKADVEALVKLGVERGSIRGRIADWLKADGASTSMISTLCLSLDLRARATAASHEEKKAAKEKAAAEAKAEEEAWEALSPCQKMVAYSMNLCDNDAAAAALLLASATELAEKSIPTPAKK